MAGFDRSTGKRARFLAALLAGNTVAAAAQVAGLSERTAYRWLSEPAFRAELAQAEGEVIDVMTRKLLDRAEGALAEVTRLMHGQVVAVDDEGRVSIAGGVPPSVRLAAARTVLESGIRFRELRTVEERLVALERLVGGLLDEDQQEQPQ